MSPSDRNQTNTLSPSVPVQDAVAAAAAAADEYAAATGMDCRVIGPDGVTLHSAARCAAAQDLCGAVGDTPPGSCAHSHLFGALQARRFGGEYIHFCRMGLVCWTSPVMRDGRMVLALTGGPVHMRDPGDLLEADDPALPDPVTRPPVWGLFAQLPVVAPEQVTGLSRVLSRITRDLSDDSYRVVDQAAQAQQIQADIWERMQVLKSFDGARDPGSYPFDMEEELLRMIEGGNRDSAQRLLNQLLGSIFFARGGDLPTLRARLVELTVLLSRAAIRGGADATQIFGMNFDYLNRITELDSRDELAAWLSRAMGRFTEQVFRLQGARDDDAVFRAAHYIRRQHRRRLTLEEVAGVVHLSPMYFSRLFKEETGVNFVTYVNLVRVETARSLLLTTRRPIADLAREAGFESQSYFSKVFRRATGMTPGSYRRNRGMTPTETATGGDRHGTDEPDFRNPSGRTRQGDQGTRAAGD